MADQTLYAVGAGYNVALGSLFTLVKTIAPGDNFPFFAPLARGFFDVGQRKYRTDGTVFNAGFQKVTWMFELLTFNQYLWLYTTILSSNYSGPVTAYTRLGTNSFSRQNAIMVLPKMVDQDASVFLLKKAKVELTRLAAAS